SETHGFAIELYYYCSYPKEKENGLYRPYISCYSYWRIFGYRSTPYGIYISKNESVSVLHTKVRNTLLHEYRNASFNLRAVDVEQSESHPL
ncbi:3428_t:CDS:2, partial [Acaulospora morrowiae]